MTKKNNKKFHLAVDTGYHDSIGDNLIITMMQKRMTKKNKKSSTWRLIQDNYDNVDNNDNDGKNENNGKDKNNKKYFHLVADTGWILGIDTARRHTSASALATPELDFGTSISY